MDLYGSGASIAQANAQTQAAREINEATTDFNNSLAEELDQANLEADEDRQAKLTKNIASGGTAAAKLALKKEIRQGAKKGIKAGGKFIKTTAAERFAKEDELEELRPAASLEETQEIYGTGARPPSPELVRGGARETLQEGEQLTADVSGETGEVGAEATARTAEEAATEGIETTGKALAKKAAEDAIEKAGLKTAGKVATKAMTFGKAGVAGLGGALDVGADVGRLIEGKSGWDAFGSNSASRAGNIMNIVGSSLEVAGVVTGGVTPWSLALEGLGAVAGLAGGITEAVGEEEASDVSKEKTEQDITSQARGQAVADQVTQVVGRTQ
jgi:hypothetical protein